MLGIVALAVAAIAVSIPLRLYRAFLTRNRFAMTGLTEARRSNPLAIAVDAERVARLDPFLATPERLAGLQHTLDLTDGRPALVVSLTPFLVAAQSDEMDAVVLLRFDPDVVPDATRRTVGDRLLCAMGYEWLRIETSDRAVAPDLREGPASSHRFDNLIPIVVDFISSDARAIETAKAAIDAAEWSRARDAGQAALAAAIAPPRDGRPSLCHLPSCGRLAWLWALTRRVGRRSDAAAVAA